MTEAHRRPEHAEVCRRAAVIRAKEPAMVEFVLVMEGACPSCLGRLHRSGYRPPAHGGAVGWCDACYRGYSAERRYRDDPLVPGWWHEIVVYGPSGSVAGRAGWVTPDRAPVAA